MHLLYFYMFSKRVQYSTVQYSTAQYCTVQYCVENDLYCVARLRGDALHGEHDLELHLAGQVSGGDLPERGV